MLARLLAALALLALAAAGFALAAAVRPASPTLPPRIAVVTTTTVPDPGYTPVPAGPPATAPVSR